MDVYNFYLSAFRYIINASPEDKSTWCDIFKYIPCLRHMLSCTVCGNILLIPHKSSQDACLHNVCQGCLGGRMRLRPSCSWCKDRSRFHENKKLRVLILCFQRLCAYVSHSRLGEEISKASINGYGSEAERTIRVLQEVEQFCDDYVFTPSPIEFPRIRKPTVRGLKSSVFRNPTSAVHYGAKEQNTEPYKRKRGRPKRVPTLSKKPANASIAIHAKKLKKMALTSAKKKPFAKTLPHQRRLERKRKPLPDTSGYLISQRPHRDKSGKYSVGQLWRETFLEEVQPESYPDSGIEVGNSPDHDLNVQPSQLVKLVSEKSDHVNKPEVSRKETRLHRHTEIENRDASLNDVASAVNEMQKPRLTLTILKKRYQTFPRKGRSFNPATSVSLKDTALKTGKQPALNLDHANLAAHFKKWTSNSVRSAKQHLEICRCARFKQPNQLTCFGQKCPCYSERRACVDCLCNGCKNPLKPPDSAPALTHVKETDRLDRTFDRSMPRLSPIPRS
ncbi:unnamed protein product [Candidula unifasciata]|uniref:CXC MSL2-type domain-containing protein n=1 Tax=Candidula unifasciata TaxID=100452 RepID=A0A8S4A472_9EUPU|nr:unnamed protein product [Candidula unifasciata]